MSSPYIMPDAEYYVGSDEVREAAGDIVEMVVGIAMMIIGAAGTGSSAALTFATAGGGAPIAIPLADVSAGVFATGVVMAWDAILSMAGKIKGNGGGQKGSPKKDSGHMVGENGTQVTSKTTWQNGKTERLDVENPAPGERDGQIHYHDANNKKYMYDFQRNVFYDEETKILAPKSVQKLLEDKKFQKGMEQALKILGEI